MALLDVSELLGDPDFTDVAQIIRRSRAVNEFGENVLTEAPTNDLLVVVQPAKPSALERLPEGAKLKESINIWFQGTINIEAVNGYSDIIVWRGDRYTVIDTDDFTNYGAGYTKALCLRGKPNA